MNIEKELLGEDEAIFKWVDSDLCMVIDWRSSPEEIISIAECFLPEDEFSYELGEEPVQELSFKKGENIVNFTLNDDELDHAWSLTLIGIASVLSPDYELHVFNHTTHSDTWALLLRPKTWWDEYRAIAADRCSEIFTPIIELLNSEPPETI